MSNQVVAKFGFTWKLGCVLLLCLAASAFTPFGRRVAAHYLPLRPFTRLTAPPAMTAPVAAPMFATLTVSNTNDSGMGSLRAAIQQANANNGDDTITFDSSFNTARTINLTSGDLFIQNGTGISGSITIQGPGADLLTINGPGNSRVFTIGNVTTAMSGLTIRGGRVTPTTGNAGGGVFTDAPLTMTNCVVTGNYADYGGGGIYLEGGGASLSLDGCTVSGNSTDTTSSARGFGGGILTFRGITLKNTTIANNTSYYGGGIWMGTLPATMINTTISGNTSVFGGGIFANEVTAAITATNTIVSGNNGGNVFLFNNAPAVAGSNNFIDWTLAKIGGSTPRF